MNNIEEKFRNILAIVKDSLKRVFDCRGNPLRQGPSLKFSDITRLLP